MLTAAHCIKDAAAPFDLLAIGGRTDMGSTKETARHVASVKVHPKFVQSTLTHVAAVITISSSMPYAPLPVAGPNDSALYSFGKTAKTVGWGRTGTDTSGTRLKSAVLTLAPLTSCEPFTDPTDSDAQKVCGVTAAGAHDSICRCDSGGLLVAGGKVIGVVSEGNKFCDYQFSVSVFTRVSAVAGALTPVRSGRGRRPAQARTRGVQAQLPCRGRPVQTFRRLRVRRLRARSGY
ncbi:trypsin-like serine protease [Streptomyces sp. NPDC056308]|uniref:S1 family peptidase n=1 Tax=Streptomyces sp. NPDC056308 TaxID=3345780 RepID=UPI0035E181FA